MQQAVRWANRGVGEPVINFYNYEPNESLKILKFPEILDEWLDSLTFVKSEVIYDSKGSK